MLLQDIIPAKYRKIVYLVYALVGLAMTSVQTGFASAQVAQPMWLVVSWAVFGVVGTGLGITAAGNINEPDEPAELRNGNFTGNQFHFEVAPYDAGGDIGAGLGNVVNDTGEPEQVAGDDGQGPQHRADD